MKVNCNLSLMLILIQIIAKIRKQSSSLQVLDCELGPTWFPALEAEFKKEYFMKVATYNTEPSFESFL
jgi:hypothetical protein